MLPFHLLSAQQTIRNLAEIYEILARECLAEKAWAPQKISKKCCPVYKLMHLTFHILLCCSQHLLVWDRKLFFVEYTELVLEDGNFTESIWYSELGNGNVFCLGNGYEARGVITKALYFWWEMSKKQLVVGTAVVCGGSLRTAPIKGCLLLVVCNFKN